jgi:hypothetical protein
MIQVKNVLGEFSFEACMKLVNAIELSDTFKIDNPEPTMPFGPTSRTFAEDGDYSHNSEEDCASRPLLCLLMKTRLSNAEVVNKTGVYFSFFGINSAILDHSRFFGTVRGFPNTTLLTDEVVGILEDIVADNEEFFHHEMPDAISYTNFRSSYDLLSANSIAAHDSRLRSTGPATSTLLHPNSKSKSKLVATINELSEIIFKCKNATGRSTKPRTGTSLLIAFQYYRSRQVCSDFYGLFALKFPSFFFFFFLFSFFLPLSSMHCLAPILNSSWSGSIRVRSWRLSGQRRHRWTRIFCWPRLRP